MADETKKVLIDIQSNLDEYRKQAVEAAKETARLKDEIKKLEKADGDNTEAIEQNKEALRASQTQYRESTKSVDQLNKALNAQSGSYEELQAQLRVAEKELKKQSGLLIKNADGTIQMSEGYKQASVEVAQAREAVNNFNLGIGNGATNVGLYEKSIVSAMSNVKIFGVDGGKAFGALGQGMEVMSKVGAMSFKSLAAAFIATGIGAIIIAIVAAIALLSKAFQRSETNMNKLKKVMGGLSGAFSGLMKVLEPVVEFIADYVVFYFDAMGKAAEKAMALVSKALRFVGLDETADKLEKFTQKIKDSVAAGQELAAMEAELEKQQRLSRKTQLDYQKEAEKLRQLRDDESRSIDDRMKKNEQLGAVLRKQLDEELKIANLGVKLAERRVQLEGESTENLDALAEAQTVVSDIEERVLSQQSEQLSNLNGLRREQKAYYEELSANLQKEESLRRARVDAEIAAEETIAELKEAARREARQKRLDAEAAERAMDLETMAINAENEMQLKILRGATELEIERQQLEASKAQEIAATEDNEASVALIQEKYRLLDIQMTEMNRDAKLSLYAGMAGQLAGIFGQQTALGKAAAVAQATIDTYLGAQAAYASGAKFGPITAAINAGVAVAAGLANVKKILAVDTKGKGTSAPSGGGAPARPSNVVTRVTGATLAGANTLNNINQGNVGATAGSISQQAQAVNNNNDKLVEAISNIKPVVTVEEIQTVTDRKNMVEVKATY
jgi:hypothetical protein